MDILLDDLDAGTLEKMFGKTKIILHCWGLQIESDKIQMGDSIHSLRL